MLFALGRFETKTLTHVFLFLRNTLETFIRSDQPDLLATAQVGTVRVIAKGGIYMYMCT